MDLFRSPLYAPTRLAGSPIHSRSMKTVVDVIRCFMFERDCLNYEADFPGRPFESAVRWLAILITRSCSNWELVVSHWIAFHRLGPLDVSRFNSLLRRSLVIDINPKEVMGNEEDLLTLPQCSFWLPHGMKRLYPTRNKPRMAWRSQC